MTIEFYLAALHEKLREIEGLVLSRTIQQEIDGTLGIGYIKGQIVFIDGSKLEFSEQLPTDRSKFRFHYMDAQKNLIVRWDSAPHHMELSTFPFHKHTQEGTEEHPGTTLLNILAEIEKAILV
ncbi:MAG: hypothetical protein HY879_06080 [Deltaproteobacteria bacterium]|nr:hypothetical protein [Deltaproteobacteria bacterium]